jgi:hypothetical protein
MECFNPKLTGYYPCLLSITESTVHGTPPEVTMSCVKATYEISKYEIRSEDSVHSQPAISEDIFI